MNPTKHNIYRTASPEAVLTFWFDEIEPKQRWQKDASFDNMIRRRFAQLHQAAAQGELYEWRQSAEGRVAEIIVLDQFSRNLFRDTAQAFAHDAMALVLAQEAVANGLDDAISKELAQFLYMPYMHSESRLIHQQAQTLFERLNKPDVVQFEQRHRDIINRFGRYPHRNKALGRTSTTEELTFLQQPGSSF